MKIQLLNPWVVDQNLTDYEREFVDRDVDIAGLKESRRGSRSNMDRSLPMLFDAVVDAERQGYDAVVIACFSDPGVEAARELVQIPVIGPLNVGLHIAQVVGKRTLLLATEYARFGRYLDRDTIAVYGLQGRVVVRGTNHSVPYALEAYRMHKLMDFASLSFIEEIVEICVRSVERDSIDAIVLGCGGLLWMKDIIEQSVKMQGHEITVINPLTAAVEMARCLAALKLTHSRLSYPGIDDACCWYDAGVRACKI